MIDNTAKIIFQFLEQFGNAIIEPLPANAIFPFIAYNYNYNEQSIDNLLQVKIYTKSTSYKEAYNIAENIEKKLSTNGYLFNSDENLLWFYKGSPFIQQKLEDDPNIRSLLVNIIYKNY